MHDYDTVDGLRKINSLTRNYSFIKHMMGEMGLKLNYDYIIVPVDRHNKTITLRFNKHSRQFSSMAVLLWGKYQHAKLESNL